MKNKNEITVGSKNYVLTTTEYIGSETFKYMIQSELHGPEKVTLFLLGIPDPALVYASTSDNSAVKEKLYQAAVDSVAAYISKNDWTEGNTYYGEYVVDGSFEITGQKPTWEDGRWGQKVDL